MTAFRLLGPECTCNLSIFKTFDRVAGGVVQSVSSALPRVEGHTVFSKNQKKKPATLSDSALTCLLDLMSDGPVCVLWGPCPHCHQHLCLCLLVQGRLESQALFLSLSVRPLQTACASRERRARKLPWAFYSVSSSQSSVFTTKETG